MGVHDDDASVGATPVKRSWGYELGGFDAWRDYAQGLLHTPVRGFKSLTRCEVQKQAAETETAGDQPVVGLKHALTWLDLMGLGVGMMLGAGVFVTTGDVAQAQSGPAIVISYAVAGLSAFLSSFCYSEFSVDLPFAGGAYSYVLGSLGEFLAWITVSNLILEYVLANAAVMRGFSGYFALLINKPSNYFVYDWHGYTVDWWAFGWPLVFTALLCYGIKESASVNLVVTIVHLLIMVFIIIAGFTQADTANFTPFAPYGWKNIFNGAAIVFFSYIGFDAVATTAEEVKDTKRDLPIGILGSVAIVTIIYILMGAVLCLMIPIDQIDPAAAFAAAFVTVGMSWARYVVAVGALLGILTSTMVGILGCSRIVNGSARQHMVPPIFALILPKYQTPWTATIAVGISTSIIGLLTDFASLLNLTSICTLLPFWLVAVALIWRRAHVPGKSTTMQLVLHGAHLLVMIGMSLGFIIMWNISDSNTGIIVFGALSFATAISMWIFCKPVYVPSKFSVPLYPLIPCGSIFINAFLLGQLPKSAYLQFLWWTLACLGLYIFYSMPAVWYREKKMEEQAALIVAETKAMDKELYAGEATEPIKAEDSTHNSE